MFLFSASYFTISSACSSISARKLFSVQKKVIDYFDSFDEHIKDFEIEKFPYDADSKEEIYKISSLHKKIDSDAFAAIPTLKSIDIFKGE